jgi:hypothetical protein
MAIVSKIKTEVSPCEYKQGCSIKNTCQIEGAVCPQYSQWENTGVIDLDKSRAPKAPAKTTIKSVVTELHLVKRSSGHNPKSKDLLERQAKHRHTLCVMSQAELGHLAPIIGYTALSLRQMRYSGLSEVFMDCMETKEIKAWLLKNKINERVAA